MLDSLWLDLTRNKLSWISLKMKSCLMTDRFESRIESEKLSQINSEKVSITRTEKGGSMKRPMEMMALVPVE